MVAKNFVKGLFILSLISGVAAQEAKAPTIKVESAVRVKLVIDTQGKEQQCVEPDDSALSCLVVKVSGIDPNKLVDIWISKEKGGVYLSTGTEKYDISTIKVQDKSKYTLIEITVPKDAKEFSLVIGDAPPTAFKVDVTILEKINETDLFKGYD